MKQESGWHYHSRRLAAAIGGKRCATCGESKRADAYYKEATGEQRAQCKACDGYPVHGYRGKA